MRCARCGKCCKETRMELSEEDLDRLTSLGYKKEEVSVVSEDGTLRLSNKEGRCVFLDDDERTCKVYTYRPLGCVIYPVNTDEEGKVFVDEFCQAWKTLSKDEMRKSGITLRNHLRTIDNEARKRLQNRHRVNE